MSRISLGGGRSVSMRNYVQGYIRTGGRSGAAAFLAAERIEESQKSRQQTERGDHGRR